MEWRNTLAYFSVASMVREKKVLRDSHQHDFNVVKNGLKSEGPIS